MNLLEAIRNREGAAWEKIPWDEPDFSRRMLREHLSQTHDAASRRFERIEQHIAWIDGELLGGKPSRVLDLGCGPGFYTERLARRGHGCTGIDFAPAAIAHARSRAAAAGLVITYRQEDLRLADFGAEYDLAMLIYGELNAFTPEEAADIVRRACGALNGSGTLLLEVSTYDAVRRAGSAPRHWYTAEQGLYSDAPYLCLTEAVWDEARALATTYYYITDAASSEARRYGSGTQAYTEEQYRALLGMSGFAEIAFRQTFGADPLEEFVVLTARAVVGG